MSAKAFGAAHPPGVSAWRGVDDAIYKYVPAGAATSVDAAVRRSRRLQLVATSRIYAEKEGSWHE